ncbi:MAG: YCF48-related protein [Acidobacteriota bacterium]
MKKLALLLLLTAAPALAGTWKAEGPYFGNVLSIAVDPANPERLWVSTHGGGVWRSVDGAKSWQLSGKALADRVVTYVMLQPKSNTLWAGVERGAIARSKDGGETWEWMRDDLALTPYPVAFDPSNPKAIWVPDVNLHKRSADGGAKWTEFRVSGGDVYTFAVHPKDSKIIWAGGSNGRSGLWRTSDGGASWKQLGTGLPEHNQPRRIVIDPSEPDTLYMAALRDGGYKSTDGGETWTPFGGSFPQQEVIESLTLHPTSPKTLYAGTKKGLMRSTDGAQTWTRMGGGLPRYVVRGLAINPAAPDVMWAGAAGAGVYKTTDGGKSWTEANAGFAAAWIENAWGNQSGTIFAQVSRGLFRTDGKGGWVELLQPFSKDNAILQSVVFDPRNPKSVHASYASSYYRSNDGGVTWAEVDTFLQEPRPAFSSVVLDVKNPKVLYSADGNPSSDEPPIFKSIDGGVKWKAANRGVPPGTDILAMRGDSSGALVAIGKEGGLWRSTDGAVSWTAAGGGLPAKDLKGLAADQNVYVAAKEGLYRSEDGGATFTQSSKGIEKKQIAAVAVDAKGNVYVGTFEGVHRSTDGGKSWTAFNDGLTNEDVRSLHSAGTRLYAGTAGGGVFSIDVQ